MGRALKVHRQTDDPVVCFRLVRLGSVRPMVDSAQLGDVHGEHDGVGIIVITSR